MHSIVVHMYRYIYIYIYIYISMCTADPMHGLSYVLCISYLCSVAYMATGVCYGIIRDLIEHLHCVFIY